MDGPSPAAVTPNPVMSIHRLLGAMKKLNASDLHLKVGVPPTYRINGVLRTVQGTGPIQEIFAALQACLSA